VLPLNQEEQHITDQELEEADFSDRIEMTDEEGNTTLFDIVDYFFYNGEEYAILTETVNEESAQPEQVAQCAQDDESEEQEEIACYIMKVVPSTDENGDEVEEFVPVEDQALEAKLIDIAGTKLNADNDLDDED